MFLLDDKPETKRLFTLHFEKVTVEAVLPKYISKRFVQRYYLNWTEEQIAENEKMWAEENKK